MIDFSTLVQDIKARDREVGAFVAFVDNPKSNIDGQFQA